MPTSVRLVRGCHMHALCSHRAVGRPLVLVSTPAWIAVGLVHAVAPPRHAHAAPCYGMGGVRKAVRALVGHVHVHMQRRAGGRAVACLRAQEAKLGRFDRVHALALSQLNSLRGAASSVYAFVATEVRAPLPADQQGPKVRPFQGFMDGWDMDMHGQTGSILRCARQTQLGVF